MSTIKRFSRVAILLPWLASAAVCVPALADGQGAKSLEGTWDVVATIRDCASGAPIRSIPRMITFAKGGTLTEAAAGGTEAAPAYRSVGMGTWEYLGESEFTYSLKFLRMTSFGGPDGFIKETRILEVSENGTRFLADGVSVITFGNGTQSPQLCTTEDATKLY
jgi:hypothetical protein